MKLKNRLGSDSPVGRFIISIKNRMGIGSPERNAADTYERRMAIVPDCIKPSENEIPIRQYNIATLRSLLKFERAEGRMQVTNQRVIFRAAGRSVGGKTALQHEFAIDEIAGIEARSNYKFSLLYLVFAILIVAAASFLIYRPHTAGIITPISTQSARISSIMWPRHVQKAYSDESLAVSQTREAEEKLPEAAKNLALVKRAEEEAAINSENGILKTRSVRRTRGRSSWYENERYRDTSPEGLQEAQGILEAATAKRKIAGEEERNIIAEIETAKRNEEKAIKSREAAVNTWKVLMSIWGLLLGIGGIIPFFALYKRFGLKLFILNFSIFGFALSSAASGISIFRLFPMLPVIITLVCIFIFCFRPNLVISIKNKMATGEGPIDIRCNDNLNRSMEILALAIIFIPVLILLGITFSSGIHTPLGNIPLLAVTLPIGIIVALILLKTHLSQKTSNGMGLDSGFAEVFPTKETEGAIREIGAMIGDIQKLGDLGIKKWLKK